MYSQAMATTPKSSNTPPRMAPPSASRLAELRRKQQGIKAEGLTTQVPETRSPPVAAELQVDDQPPAAAVAAGPATELLNDLDEAFTALRVAMERAASRHDQNVAGGDMQVKSYL